MRPRRHGDGAQQNEQAQDPFIVLLVAFDPPVASHVAAACVVIRCSMIGRPAAGLEPRPPRARRRAGARRRSGPDRRPGARSRPRRPRSRPAPRPRRVGRVQRDRGDAGGPERQRDALVEIDELGERRQRMARVALDLGRARPVAEDEHVRRRAVDQPERHARVRRVRRARPGPRPKQLAAALARPRRRAARPRRRGSRRRRRRRRSPSRRSRSRSGRSGRTPRRARGGAPRGRARARRSSSRSRSRSRR